MKRFISVLLVLFSVCGGARAQINLTVANGDTIKPIIFPGTQCVYNWVNDNPAIGLPASGISMGSIASFTTVNNTNKPVTATITATPAPGLAYITNYGSNTVSIINTDINKVIATIQVGQGPQGLTLSPDKSKLYVNNYTSKNISVISTVTNTVIGTINLPSDSAPYCITTSLDGTRLYITDQYGYILVVDAINNQLLTTISTGQYSYGIATSPDGSKVYAVSGIYIYHYVSIINTATNMSIASINASFLPIGVAVHPDGSKLYLISYSGVGVYVFNTTTNLVTDTIHTAGVTQDGIAITPDGSRVYVSNASTNNVTVINTATNSVITDIPVGPGPRGISVTPDGAQVYVSNYASDNVSVINTATNTVIATIPVGIGPVSLGDFIKGGINCQPATYTITVNPTTAFINNTNVLAGLNTVYGAPSVSTSFTVSGNQIVNGIVVTPPTGLEVSTDNINFSNQVTVSGNGTIPATTVYIRLAATASAGNYSGNIILSSLNALKVKVPMPLSTVSPALLTVIVDNQSRAYGAADPVFTVTYKGFVNNDGASQLTVQPSVKTNAFTNSPPGQYVIIASAAASPNYTFNYIQGTLTVVKGFQDLIIPNVFTPNNDGINDTWNIKYLNTYTNTTVQIFNRQGQKVFFSKGYPVPWDGRYKGSNLPDGTYYYIINLNSGASTITGHVSIIR